MNIRTVIVAWLLLLGSACGGYQPPTLGACGEGTSLDEGDCTGFVAADRCFGSKAAACDCLGCAMDQCQIAEAESGPSEVRCVAK